MKPRNIEVRAAPVSHVLKQLYQGRFAIPRLQREFVWNGTKAAKLLDSLYRGLPIGTVLIWDAPKHQRLHLRQKFHVLPPFNQKNSSVWFLIDGQQRISVLHNVREGAKLRNSKGQEIDFARVVLALQREEDGQQIRYRKPSEGQYVSLSAVLHPSWRQKLGGLGPKKLERVRKCREAILNYRIFQLFIHGQLEAVREAFIRINTQGMKVTTADAVFTKAENLDLREVAHSLREQLDEQFRGVGDEPLNFLMSAVLGGSEARGRAIDALIERVNKAAGKDSRLRSGIARDWNRLAPCIAKAANYLRERFAVVNRSFLASDYVLVMLAYFYYLNRTGPDKKQAEQIRKWFWATCVGSRYSGRDFNRCVPDDLAFFRALSKSSSRQFKYVPQVESSDVKRAQYGTSSAIAAAVSCMLLRRRPVYLLDDGLNDIPVQVYAGRADRKDRHHIFPRQQLANVGVRASQYNSIANICLLTAEENQQIGSARPSKYLGERNRPGQNFKAKMRRHLISCGEESGLWDRDIERGFKRFLGVRTLEICSALEEEAGLKLFRREA